jgi:DNA-binding MarR family transcriptional regulator
MKKHIAFPPLTPIQLEVINGALLGDGSLHHIKNTNANWKFVTSQSAYDNKGIDKSTYMQYIFDALQPYSSKLAKYDNNNTILNINGRMINLHKEDDKKYHSLTTHCHPVWTNMAKDWYLWKNGNLVLKDNKIIKIVPEELKLTPLTLCIWFMDDGSLDSKRGNATIHTEGFTVNECNLLIEKLKDVGIFAKLKFKKTYPIIFIGIKSYYKLLSLITPHVHWSCFQYKIDKSYSKKHQQGEHHSQSKLTEIKVKKIIALYNEGIYQKDIAKQFNISQATISEIVTGKNWSHLNLGTPGRRFSKLSMDQNQLIIKEVRTGAKQKDIAQKFNIDQSTVSKILKNVQIISI